MSTTLSPATIKRALKEIPSYLEAQLRYCYTDCSDGMNDAERRESRFSAIVDDKVTIDAFIEQHCLDLYVKAWQETIAEWVPDDSDEDKQNPSVCALPVPYERFKHLLSTTAARPMSGKTHVIPDRIGALAALLTTADEAYYNSGAALMEDALYDSLRAELRTLAPDHPALTRVGAPASRDSMLAKRKHAIPMGSLDKAMDRAEWDAWVAKQAKAGHTRFTASLKMDGGSVSLEYRKGDLVAAVTRGDGLVGEDITANALRFTGLPTKGVKLAGAPFTGHVRAEIMLTTDRWLEADPDQTSNPRNLGNGISRRKDGTQSELLTAYAFRAYGADGLEIAASELLMAAELCRMGFPSTDVCHGSPDNVWEWFEQIATERSQLPFWIDGVVVKVDDIAAQRALGESSGCPRGQVAIKFPAAGALTKVLSVELTVGHTGAIVPTAALEPCQIGGTTVSNVLLCNWDIIEALDVAVGDTVEVVKSGDIIPRIVRVDTRPKGRTLIPKPKCCPSCGGMVGYRATVSGADSAAIYCANDDCPAQVTGKIARFIASVGILGIGDEVLEALVEIGLVESAADLFTLHECADEMADLLVGNGRLGESRVERILAEIDKVRSLTLAQFLGSIGVDGLGKRRVALIQAAVPGQFDTLSDWQSGKLADLAAEAGVPNTGARMSEAIADAGPLIMDFLDNGLIIAPPVAAKVAKVGAKSFCITGKTARTRDDLVAAIEAAGHTFKSSVSKGLDYLVIADPESTSSKAVKARKLGTVCISEEQLEAMLEGRA